MDDDGERRGFNWERAGKVLAVVIGVMGFFALGAIVLFLWAMNSWANSK